MDKAQVIVVDDEESALEMLGHAINDMGFEPHCFSDGYEALRRMEKNPAPLVLTDVSMPGMNGLALLKEIRERWPSSSVVLMTAFGSVESAVEAMKHGAFDFITKPFLLDKLKLVLRNGMEHARLKGRVEILSEMLNEDYTFSNFVCESPNMKRVVRLIRKAAATGSSVLIQGESGTGKEVAARALHRLSARRDEPFVAVNCAALPAQLMESELFGHVKGAFTGAVRDRIGYFEAANRGTLFLDEIGDLALPLQAKLLRALQEREIVRLGSPMPLSVDVRVVAASNRSLAQEAASGNFREDLYYRLNVVTIEMPPLRDRREDILPLAERFLESFAARSNRSAPYRLSAKARRALERYPYPGNVRELENALERAATFAQDDEIAVPDLPPEFEQPATEQYESIEGKKFKQMKKEATDRVEQAILIRALQSHGGHVTNAAASLGLGRTALQRLLKKHNLHSSDFKT